MFDLLENGLSGFRNGSFSGGESMSGGGVFELVPVPPWLSPGRSLRIENGALRILPHPTISQGMRLH